MHNQNSIKAGERTQPNPYTMPKHVHCLSFINPGEKVMLGECSYLDLGSGTVGYSTRVNDQNGVEIERNIQYVRRALAYIFASYPQSIGKVAIFRCPFAFAPRDTFELVETDAPEYATEAEELADSERKYGPFYPSKEAYFNGIKQTI